MKTKFFAAILLIGSALPLASKAQVVPPAPGVLPGAGTINYNFTSGESSAFNVGANTRVGLDSSVSSTDAYSSSASGSLGLGGGGFGYGVSYTGSGSGAVKVGASNADGWEWDGTGAGAGAVTVDFTYGASAIRQSIGTSASAEASAGSVDKAAATAGIGVVGGTFTSGADESGVKTATAVVSGLSNTSNILLSTDSKVDTAVVFTSLGSVEGTSNTGNAASSAIISTTANAQTSNSTFDTGFVNVLTDTMLKANY